MTLLANMCLYNSSTCTYIVIEPPLIPVQISCSIAKNRNTHAKCQCCVCLLGGGIRGIVGVEGVLYWTG